MRELSLNILDIAQNSVAAGAKNIWLTVEADTQGDLLTVVIRDDGCGMTPEFLARVTDPFSTTRKTRKVGMGLPLYRMGAQMSEGTFDIDSTVSVGTTVTTTYRLGHIDRQPLGDLAGTVTMLINGSPDADIFLKYTVDGRTFCFDTVQIKEMLDGVPVDSPEIILYISQLLTENLAQINGGKPI